MTSWKPLAVCIQESWWEHPPTIPVFGMDYVIVHSATRYRRERPLLTILRKGTVVRQVAMVEQSCFSAQVINIRVDGFRGVIINVHVRSSENQKGCGEVIKLIEEILGKNVYVLLAGDFNR